MGLNLELKARLSDLEKTKELVETIKSIRYEGKDVQNDTFFNVNNGRLKLRESDIYGNILIPYLRDDNHNAKACNYSLIEIKDKGTLKDIFSTMFGIRTVVEKTRYIFHYENVRIHLDRVKNLGEFLEFEAVLSDEYDQNDGQKKINYLMDYLGIDEGDLISIAYVDMLEDNSMKKV